ncbi:MAG: glycyl-radical enzyme activating protein [Eubacterium sp.]|nr:glycyl-radical enzyme activating protein [Eubacterium sp.]
MTGKNEEKALVFDIYRGTIHDGPGMRTTIFMKGCPLRCKWCHNPEGMSSVNGVMYERSKCLGCRMCSALAQKEIVSVEGGTPHLVAEHTDIPAECAEECPGNALKAEGSRYSAEELFQRASRDANFFKSFGGGVTISGGEPTQQYHVVGEVLKKLKDAGVHTALDTCGYASWLVFEKLLPYVDIVLYDVKIADPVKHLELTGVENGQILDNLKRLTAYRREVRSELNIWIRTPLIPVDTATEENIEAIGRILTDVGEQQIDRWEMCAFNNTCESKYEKTGRDWPYAGVPLMTDEEADAMVSAGGRSFNRDKIIRSGFTGRNDQKIK